jgi:hypothetical protein
MKRFVQVSALLWLVISVLLACEYENKAKPISPRNPENPDIVIIGSEIEGIYLARAATDEGLSVAVLDPRNQPGGQLIQGEMLYLDEPFDDRWQSLLQGRVKELFDLYKKGTTRNAEVNGYPGYLYIRDFDRYETEYVLQAIPSTFKEQAPILGGQAPESRTSTECRCALLC